jgi:putative N6-adenine-specific DNA methylase
MYPILITCPLELPRILAAEVEALGLPIIAMHKAGVETQGTFEDCMRLNLWLRTAHRVLLRLHEWKATSPDAMYAGVKSVEWERWIDPDGYVSVVSSVKTPSIDNSLFANVKCKDAVVDRIRDKTGRRPDSGSSNDYAVLYLYWHADVAMIYVDTSGTSLSDRGYRLNPHKAPMRESLAAAVILSMQWEPGTVFVNPMCGSGTLGIEAALLGINRAPGLTRTNFGFMHVQPYDPKVFDAMVKEARSKERKSRSPFVLCSDNDRRAIEATRENAKAAGVLHLIETGVCDFTETPIPPAPGAIVLNPEYGLRLGNVSALIDVYADIGDFFKQKCKGYWAYIFTGNLELVKHVGLAAKKRMVFYSADLECRLFEYEIYDGSRRPPKAVSEA